jgi:uncharacterized protein (DUF1499 family)
MWKRRFINLALLLAIAGAIVLPLSGLGNRFEMWSFRTGFAMLPWGLGLTVAGFVLGVVTLVWALIAQPRSGVGRALAAVLIAAAVGVIPGRMLLETRTNNYPMIHDITTDMTNPPEFVAVMPARGSDSNTANYAENTLPFGPDKGKSYAQIQTQYYPDIQPVQLNESPDKAFDTALEAAKGMGWVIVASEPDKGRIEATATTFWFGFKDDVVIRLTPEGSGTRVDVRSLSRVGVGDLGTNAKRVRAYMEKLTAG